MDFSRSHEIVLSLERLAASTTSSQSFPVSTSSATTNGFTKRSSSGRRGVARSVSCYYEGGVDGGAESAVKRLVEKLCSRVHRGKDNAGELSWRFSNQDLLQY